MANSAFEQIVEDFEFLEDWEDRYRYVIEEGKKMPALDETLKVDKKGVFSLIETEIPNRVLDLLPLLESTLEDAVANLPEALPATKTNVGVYVDTQFTLPIQISAQPIE